MNVLSLFNGMSFGKMALESLDIKVNKYYSSEIDKYANQATQTMFPDTVQLGDVTGWREWDIDWASIDLVTGGFPCQAWSMAGKQLGDKDGRGMLFWTMLDIIKHVKWANPKTKFLIENVKMKKEFEQYITTHTENALGKVHKILINSALVSAQNRNRYYWTSFEVAQPDDKGILLKDIIESGDVDRDKSRAIISSIGRTTGREYFKKYQGQLVSTIRVDTASDIKGHDYNRRIYSGDGKAPTLAASSGGNLEPKISINKVDDECIKNVNYRKLTPRECFRLQTVPEPHIDTLLSAGISNTQLYKMCGNGFTMLVISHILSHMK